MNAMGTLGAFFGVAAVIVLGASWMFGGTIGAVYWAIEENYTDAILSIVIPLYGAVTVILDVL